MNVNINLDKTTVTIFKSLYGLFDLLSDMSGLFNIIVIIIGLFLQPYNSALSYYNNISKFYKLKEPIGTFFDFCRNNMASCVTSNKQTENIDNAIESFDSELNLSDFIIKMR